MVGGCFESNSAGVAIQSIAAYTASLQLGQPTRPRKSSAMEMEGYKADSRLNQTELYNTKTLHKYTQRFDAFQSQNREEECVF